METQMNGLAPANALSRNIKTESKAVTRDFNPLDSYGDWVSIPYPVLAEESREIIMREVKAALHEQIDAVIPNYWVYRKQVMFKETQQLDTLERQIAWLYQPNLRIIEAELGKIVRRLNKVRDPVVYKIENVEDGWWHQVRMNVGTPGERVMSWLFTTKERAQAWINGRGDSV